MVDAPNAVSAILNFTRIGNKINSDALNNLIYPDGLQKRKSGETGEDTLDSASIKQVKVEDSGVTPAGPRSLLSGLTLKY